MSPIGITSISVSAMPLPCAHSISAGISSSFKFFSATALILTASPAARAASMPACTLSRSPQRVMARNFAGSSVSIETLMRRTPQSRNSPAKRASCEPLVVSVSSLRAPVFEMARQRAHQRHHIAPDQRLAAGKPQLPYAPGDEGRTKPVKLFEREQIGLGQKCHVLRHAIKAAQIAAIGDRYPQIADRPAERIGHRTRERSGRNSARVRSFNTPCHCGSRHKGMARAFRSHNLCMMQSAYNRHFAWCSASNQRQSAAAARRWRRFGERRSRGRRARRPLAAWAFSALAPSSGRPWAAGRPAAVPRPPDWDRLSSRQGS